MLEKIKGACSRIAGAVVGLGRGFISGAYHGYRYPARLSEHHPLLHRLLNMTSGAFRFAGKGAYAGATQGLMAGYHYPQAVYQAYFENIDRLTALEARLLALPRDSFRFFLSKDEKAKFEGFLASIYEDQEIHPDLMIQYNKYQAYLETRCPFSNVMLGVHRDPVVLRNETNQEFVYSYTALCGYIQRSKAADSVVRLANFPDFSPTQIISRDSPQALRAIVISARQQIHPMGPIMAHQNRDPELRLTPSSMNGGRYAPMWSTEVDTEIVPPARLATPLLPRR